nr:MerR family DNA-binding transcriptional regulator [Lactiplantibacillus plantarum]
MSYSIGQVADKLGVTIDTIRYYDKSGLLPFVKRNSIGRREFTDNDSTFDEDHCMSQKCGCVSS